MPIANRPRSRPRLRGRLAASLAATLLWPACGGSGSSPTAPSPTPSPTAPAGPSAARPFPQNVAYERGFKPSNLGAEDARAVYTTWKQRYLKADCGPSLLRVEFQSPVGTTVSEGMGYGMLLTAYFGDRREFDELYAFVKKNWNANGLMGWKVTCAGPITDPGTWGQNAATDGELDIALALVVAANQWGGAYWDEARGYAQRMRSKLWQYCAASGRQVQKPGDTFGGCDLGNTSYWMPGYYRVFAELTGESFWNDAVTGAYAQIFANRNPVTGFLANQADEWGRTVGEPRVDYNGCRVPWRIVTDHLWWGSSEAQEVTDRLTAWAGAQGISTLVDGYLVDGTRYPGSTWTRSNPWTGGWSTGAMSHSQARVDEFTAWFKGCGADDGYYDTSLRALYMLTLTGNFWRPSGRP